jgi:hypothetical protein
VPTARGYENLPSDAPEDHGPVQPHVRYLPLITWPGPKSTHQDFSALSGAPPSFIYLCNTIRRGSLQRPRRLNHHAGCLLRAGAGHRGDVRCGKRRSLDWPSCIKAGPAWATLIVEERASVPGRFVRKTLDPSSVRPSRQGCRARSHTQQPQIQFF